MLGGAALVASAFAHWVSRGDGSGLRGHALIDAVVAVGRHFPGMSAARFTVVWYLVPAAGAASWVAAGWRGARSRATRAVAVAAAIAVLLSTVAFGWLAGFSHLGSGAWLALGGTVALVAGAWLVGPTPARADSSVRMADRGR
jgi:hypothetical protein